MTNALPDPSIPLSFHFDGPIQKCFQTQADLTPGARALSYRNEECTYGELEEIGNRIAAYLNGQGIGPGQSVAILTDRNPALVYAMLGVLKSGAAFFVADAAYPTSRLLECFAIALPACTLVCGDVEMPPGLLDGLKAIPAMQVPWGKAECLRSFPDARSKSADEASFENSNAYYAFTSGSTGRPKAIVTAHAPLVHFVDWHARTHGFTAADRFSLISGLGHDPVLRDIFTPLSIGASLHIPEQATIFDPYKLAGWLAEHAISVIHLTPALGQIIHSGAESSGPLDNVRFLFWGGDVLGAKLSHGIRTVTPNARQVNFYGATETPQVMSFFEIETGDARESYPLGRGIADVQLLVITPENRLAEPGEVGEILVRTPYLSRGYLDDPERTRAAFVPNPLTGSPADLCYRTGDLGKYLPDANVAFAGRTDHQVKIRGYRVELDEIRTKIEQQPGVVRAVVLAQDMGRTSRVLVAYYTCEPDRLLESSALQAGLRGLLPAYMVPTYLIRLDSFPLLPNGKIDLRALPTPADAVARPGGANAAPSSEREAQLAQIWKELLGVDSIGVHESFLDLGGDSLSMIGVLVRMRQLGIPEAVARGVIQGKTIAQLVQEEQGIATAGPSIRLVGPAKTNLLVNCLRGILVSIVVAGHWFPGFLNRLPHSFAGLQRVLDPLFNMATPGFAFVFGITLGYYYYPKYAHNRARVRYMLNFGLCLVGASILIEELLTLSVHAVQGEPITTHEVWTAFFGPLLYYFLALATAPLWFRIIGRFRSEIGACFGLIIVFYLIHHGIALVLLDREQTGFLQLGRLMLVAKYAYFNMSIGALAGAALGIYLVRRPNASWLAGKLFLVGLLLAVAGLSYLRIDRGDLAALSNGDDMGMWRWAVYSAVVLITGSLLTMLMDRYERLPGALRRIVNLTGILGQCSLLIYVLHGVVLQAKVLLSATGLPEPLALAIPLLAFLGCCWLVMNRIYRLYYGSFLAEAAD